MEPLAKLQFGEENLQMPVVTGTEDEHGVDIGKLRSQTGLVTLDEGYVNTASTRSAITFLDGEKGILRYRGYPIEVLAERCDFVEVAYLLIYGELPTQHQLQDGHRFGTRTRGNKLYRRLTLRIEMRGYAFFDEERAEIQKQLDEKLPGTMNSLGTITVPWCSSW